MIFGIADALGLSGARALARAIGTAGGKQRVLTLDPGAARALEQAGHVSLLARIDGGRLQSDENEADALCLSGLPDDPAQLRECTRAVKVGGRVIVASGMALSRRAAERHVVTAMLLHAGIIDIEQRWSRGILLTSGRVRR